MSLFYFRADHDKKLEDAIQMLRKAVDVGRKVITIQEALALGTTSKRMLYRAYEEHAVCNGFLADVYGRLGGMYCILFEFWFVFAHFSLMILKCGGYSLFTFVDCNMLTAACTMCH